MNKTGKKIDRQALVIGAMSGTARLGVGRCDNCRAGTEWYVLVDGTYICKECGRAYELDKKFFWLND